MKILLIGPAYPLRGGMAQFFSLLFGALNKAGHDTVFHRFIRQYPTFLFPGKTQKDESGTPVKVESLPYFNPLNPFNWPLAAVRIARERPDLVILNWWIPFFGPSYAATLWLASRLCKTRVIYMVHNAIPHEKRPGDMIFTRLAFGVADGFIVMSEAVKDDLLKLKPGAQCMYNPLPLFDLFGEPHDKETAKRALGVSGHVILFFGLVRAYKGLMVLLDAMPEILGRRDLTLLVAGEFYEDKQEYIDKIGALGIAGSVRVLDRFIPNEEVGNYFSAADLLVLPYRSATQSAITQIAFVFGTPVVASRVGGLPEVVKDNETGYLVPPDDPHALADAVLRFFEEGKTDTFRRNMEAGRKRFSWEGMVESITKLYSQLPR